MRRLIAAALLVCLVAALAGCSLFSETYVSQQPHHGNNGSNQSGQQIASSYPEILDALTTLVVQGETSGVIILSDLSEQVGMSYMQAAVKNLQLQDPVAAYAVEDINYDMGTNAGRMAVAVKIDYSRSRADILSIKSVADMEEARQLVGQSLEQAVSSVTFCVDAFEQTDFTVLVQQYAQENASMVMETPQVMTAIYPRSGSNRLVELTFTYQTSQEELQKMQALVRPVFTAAELYVQGASSSRMKFQRLHAFLMERSDYVFRNSTTPTYSLLEEGIGDSKAFACVYAAMCRQAGLECRVIQGVKDGKEWFWNRVVISNRVYYIDLIESEQTGRLQFKTSSEMIGYSWNR